MNSDANVLASLGNRLMNIAQACKEMSDPPYEQHMDKVSWQSAVFTISLQIQELERILDDD